MPKRLENGSYHQDLIRGVVHASHPAADLPPGEDFAHTHHESVNEHGFPVFGHEDIAALAYQLWQDRGCPIGSPEVDWFHAAQQLRDRKELHDRNEAPRK